MKNKTLFLIFLLVPLLIYCQQYDKIYFELNQAKKAFEASDYKTAAIKFELANKILLTDKGYLDPGTAYNAAVSYKLAKDYTNSSRTFQKLIDEDLIKPYTAHYGVSDKGENFILTEKDYTSMKSSGNTKFKSYKSVEMKINAISVFENLILDYIQLKNLKKAKEIAQKAQNNFPAYSDFEEYSKNIDFAIQKLNDINLSKKELAEKYPNNGYHQYNLAISQINNPSKLAENEELLEKAVALNVKNPNAYIQLLKFYIKDDAELMNEINKNLGPSKEQRDKRASIINDRKALYKTKMIPVIEKATSLYPDDGRIEFIAKKITESHKDM